MGTDAEGTHEDLILRVAKTLQGSFAKQMTGTPRKWREVTPDEKKAWVRLARMADKMLSDTNGSNPTAPASASVAPTVDPEPLPAAAAPHSPAASSKEKPVVAAASSPQETASKPSGTLGWASLLGRQFRETKAK